MSGATQDPTCQVQHEILHVRCSMRFCMSGAARDLACQVHKILHVRCSTRSCVLDAQDPACQVQHEILHVRCTRSCMPRAA
eukprot:648137-Pelagomonas_calceolata.AAC.2